ncbi:MAG: Gfo/Idh/MocA family oxidoreductase [Bacteroidales bacterium]|nr:Gfo/Idh/MocA family oxidoreductase [Bacteroidales bacterium]
MVRFGIIGTGRISDWVLKGAVQDPRIKIVAVCSRTVEAAEAFIARNPMAAGAKVYTSVEDMAADTQVDAVYVGTPNQTHCSYTIAALKAGKHVLCEKPLALNAEEGRQMVEAARESGCLLMEAMVSTLNPNFIAAASRIAEIQPVRQYSSYFCQYSSKFEALKRGEVGTAFKPGTAGALRDVGVYTLYPLVALFGKPSSVKGKLSTWQTPEGETDVYGTAFLGYDGMDATLTWSKTFDSFQPTEIAGENGNLILDEIHIARKAEIVPHADPTSGLGPKPGRTVISEGLPYNEYYYEFKEFADLIEQGRTESSRNSLETSLTVLEIIDELLTDWK